MGALPGELADVYRPDGMIAASVSSIDRASSKNQRAGVFWLTGLSGAGKTTIGRALELWLHGAGKHAYVLDGDEIRASVSNGLGFTPADRAENIRRIAAIAQILADAGLIVIVTVVSPFRADRDAARLTLQSWPFVEVWVSTPIELCARRDPKGLYAKAQSGEIRDMTGLGQAYEAPHQPEVTVMGTGAVDTAVEKILAEGFWE